MTFEVVTVVITLLRGIVFFAPILVDIASVITVLAARDRTILHPALTARD
jgi:hypothetical protein